MTERTRCRKSESNPQEHRATLEGFKSAGHPSKITEAASFFAQARESPCFGCGAWRLAGYLESMLRSLALGLPIRGRSLE